MFGRPRGHGASDRARRLSAADCGELQSACGDLAMRSGVSTTNRASRMMFPHGCGRVATVPVSCFCASASAVCLKFGLSRHQSFCWMRPWRFAQIPTVFRRDRDEITLFGIDRFDVCSFVDIAGSLCDARIETIWPILRSAGEIRSDPRRNWGRRAVLPSGHRDQRSGASRIARAVDSITERRGSLDACADRR